ncbi:MAG: prepilin-type N-terminal cleavage/methylation domain-containing protein [Phycisphaerae bacterium]|jgi:prepilin-type N-terminal cleavage/methylation domain-containing protein
MYKITKKLRINIFKRQSRKGLTLPEVIVASALLLIALVPILKALTQVNMNAVTIERKTQSLCLAKTKLNQIQAQSIYNFDSVISQSNEVLSGSYLCNTTSQAVPGNSNLKSITIAVGMDRNSSGTLNGTEIEITLQTQIARRQ